MDVLVDTNILLRLVQVHHPQHGVVEHALAVLRMRDETLSVAVQNLVEFWAVAIKLG